MTREEIVEAIADDKMMPYINPDFLPRIVDFVIKNYNPSLPSNLDEAELKHVELSDYPPANQEEELMVYNAFKAGAEWMANSGIVTEAFIRADGMGVPMIHFYDDEVKELIGDKVVVQIRKK